MPLQNTCAVRINRPDGLAERILDDSAIDSLGSFIKKADQTWSLEYCTALDGFSLATLYHKLANTDKTRHVTAIRDETASVFGVYATSPWHIRSRPYGTAECFLWKKTQQGLSFYCATQENNFYLMSEKKYIAAGCSNSVFGLYVDGFLRSGTSYGVRTYGNSVLSSSSRFQCRGLEVWGIET
ncbi:MAG: TLD domain-containing protein [Amphiamblys sp. WSBS2006]|nr:MAG: TLD domain-containing protein [Amphiamblys sp. WSBS2006]